MKNYILGLCSASFLISIGIGLWSHFDNASSGWAYLLGFSLIGLLVIGAYELA